MHSKIIFFLQILQKLIQNDKDENQGDAHNFLSGPSINVSIRRNYIYEDAYDKLSPENGMQHFMEKKDIYCSEYYMNHFWPLWEKNILK